MHLGGGILRFLGGNWRVFGIFPPCHSVDGCNRRAGVWDSGNLQGLRMLSDQLQAELLLKRIWALVLEERNGSGGIR